jgi:IS5 family transposase
VRKAHEIPWDGIVNIYLNQLNNHKTCVSNINPRVLLGAMMVKHILNLSDEDTIQMTREDLYIQYFLGFDRFTSHTPFDSSLFVEILKRMGMDDLNRINDAIYKAATGNLVSTADKSEDGTHDEDMNRINPSEQEDPKAESWDESAKDEMITHSGRMPLDATACPQDITYPTNLKFLNYSRGRNVSKSSTRCTCRSCMEGRSRGPIARRHARYI